ncbi:MAG: type IV pilus twitching motility protein PilT [Pyrinomonadaceae bacterium]
MEKLNEYLQTLLSSCSDELRLEPDKNPYLIAKNRTTDVANTPLMGTQISTMVFPLIPADVKSALPHSSEIEFVHPHNLGNFNFNVQKSPAGFIVTIRPLLVDLGSSIQVPKPLPEVAPAYTAELGTPYNARNEIPEQPSYLEPPLVSEAAPDVFYDLESSSLDYDRTAAEPAETSSLADLIYEQKETAKEYVPSSGMPEIEVVSFNDPEYQTVFSDTATYEPPGRRDDFGTGEYVPTTEYVEMNQETFVPPSAPVTPPPPAYTPTPPPAQLAFIPAAANAGLAAKMDELFNMMAELGASDLHLAVSMPPLIRKDGKMKPLREGDAVLTPDAMCELLTSIMPARNQEEFAMRSDTDFAYEIPGLARFRCNIFMDRKGMGGVFRIIPSKMTTASQIGLSDAILGLCGLSKGLVVVTGPTGSGKSTTLCAMVNEINMTREEHIITIEDPIEFVHENVKCLVNQREVHNHTDSFKGALRAALREDPDIVLVGEMRDLETISIAIETAETGHLVFGTLHTTTAASTVDRIIDQFPADRQQQIRVMLSESLKGVIAQTLLPKKGGGRVAALEILIVTPAISNLIREGKVFQIPSAMQTGKNLGMVMLNDALFEHVQKGTVEPVDAYMKAVDKTSFETMLTRGGFKL